MPKKLILQILIPLFWIQSQAAFTQPDSTYTMPLWRARLIIQDAVIKRYQDTLIEALQTKIDTLEGYYTSREKGFANRMFLINQESKKETELRVYSDQLNNYYKDISKRYKKQRNLAIYGVVAVVGYHTIKSAIQVFKPP